MDETDYKGFRATTPELFKELDEAVRQMLYAPNKELGKMCANDLINRVLILENEKYLVPYSYKSIAYFYGDWIKSLSQ